MTARRPRALLVAGGVVVAVVAVALVAVLVTRSRHHRPPTGTYVAMGDSYSAGAGIVGVVGDPWQCFRSSRSFPNLVDERLTRDRVARFTLRDVSCNGASTDNFGHPQSVAKATNPPQFDAVGAGTRLVTFTIGANDIGFPSFVLHCVTRPDPGVCKRRFVHGSRDDLRVAISLLGPKLSTAIGDLRRRAPDARIVVVGYPTIFPGDGSCPGVPVNPDDIRYLAGVLSDLDSTLAAAAKSSGVTFVDTARSSVGHDMCAGADRWVNPPGIDVPKVRDGLIAHPNSAGTRRIATLVTAAVEQELGR